MSEILLVEDDRAMARALDLLLAPRGRVTVVRTFGAARKALTASGYDLIITDHELPGGSGLEVFALVPETTPVIVITAFATKQIAIQSVNAHAFGFLEKPFDPAELLALVDSALSSRKQPRDPARPEATPAITKRRDAVVNDPRRLREIGSVDRAIHTARSLARAAAEQSEDRAVAARGNARLEPRLHETSSRWRLTPRETEVLAEIVQGRTNRTIAELLGCAEHTVEIHVTRVLEKAAVESRAAVIARFWMEGGA